MTSGTGTCRSSGRQAAGTPRDRFPGAPAARRGFTLIEMLVLIIIMAVISSVAVPAYARFHARTRFQQHVQETAALMAWARDAAVQSDADCTVHFDPQTETFTVTVETPDPGDDQPTALQEATDTPAPAEPRTVTLGENMAVVDFGVGDPQSGAGPGDSTATDFHFHEDGSADAAHFTLRSMDGYGALLEIVPTTGRVVVTDETDLQ